MRCSVAVLLVVMAPAVVAASGCGAPDCSETATCAAALGDDGPGGSDVTVQVDAKFDGPLAEGQREAGADAQSDGNLPRDSAFDVVPFDAFVLPDSPIDSSCPNGVGEDCTNGVDDNCNGLIDCADPLCQSGYSCDPPPPSGWLGPIELYVSSTSVPSCASPYADDVVDGNAGLNVPMAQCTCQCGPVSGVDCGSAAEWQVYSDNACGTQCDGKVMPTGAGNFCESTSGCSGSASIKSTAAPPALNLASCHANPSTTLPGVTWQQVARGCGYSGPPDTGGCTGGASCVATATQGKACVYATGSLPCPAGAYSAKDVFYASTTESRTCTACSCGTPTGVTCQVTGTLFTYGGAFGCMGTATGSTSAFDGTTCTPLGGGGASGGVEGLVTTAPSGGSCAASGGAPAGTVTAAQPTTVCCMP